MEMPNDTTHLDSNLGESTDNTSHDLDSPKFQGFYSEKKKNWLMIALGIFIAILMAGSFVYVMAKKKSLEVLSPFSDAVPDNKKISEKKVVNPITGIEFSESDAPWTKYRPLGVMVNNYIDARPQSGLADADLVYEIVAEGGITRFLAFYLTNTPEKLGPIRSTREYYLVLVKELGDAMLMHHGYSPQALEAIQSWPIRSLQRGDAPYWRDTSRDVAVEHTLYANGVDLRKRGDELGWEGTRDFVSYKFKDDKPILELLETDDPKAVGQDPFIEIHFWYEGDYSGIFEYKPDSNSYLRYTGYDANGDPIAHKDAETDIQVEVKNLIVQFVTEKAIVGDDSNRLEYELIGSGEGNVFMDGKVVGITWTKADRDSRTMFYDQDGNEIEFNRGKFWIAIAPDRNVDQVTY
ncbi:DUF3048 domain-containing protein [Patescibacteria group bacterium]|nr:DUF3048 domain-containing protein [Patescibacteria group bacterium]